jgi:hypothetical protein
MARKFCAALLAALLFPGGLPAQQPGETFSESLTVREREILVDLPEGIDGDRLDPGDFRVLVDGVPREVTRAEPASDWTIVLYVDQVLASPGTVFYSTLALANRARALARTGTVEVVVADSEPHTLLPATREEKRIAQTLTDLSAAARVERDLREGRAKGEGEPSVEQARRQLGKLLAFLASRRPSGPHAVFLVADGPDLTPEETALLERKDDPAAAPASVFHRASRLLAAYGWVTLPVPLRKEGAGVAIAPQSGLERIRQSAAPSKHQSAVPPITPSRAPRETPLAWTGVIDLATEPRTAALRVLSRASGGTVLGFEQQIEPALAALASRWRLWVDEPDEPVDGRLHTVAVRLPDQMQVVAFFFPIAINLPGGAKRTARPQAWLRSSTPQEIAEVRLEGLLAGREVPGGDLPLTAELHRTVTAEVGPELRIDVAPVQNPERPGPVRISWGCSDGEVRHQTIPVESLDKGFRQTIRIESPGGTRRIAVVVEALGPERWAGKVLEIEPSP